LGLADRDYMSERRHDEPPFSRASNTPSFVKPVLFWLVLAFLLFKAWGWWEHKAQARRQVERDRISASAQAFPQHAPTISPAPAPQDESVGAKRAVTEATKAVTRCVRDGTVTYSDAGCGPATRRTVLAGVPAGDDEIQSTPGSHTDPAVDRGTIYLCKAYDGGTFWAQAHCNQHKALIERIAHVPENLPFDQKVALASAQQRNAAQAAIVPISATDPTVISQAAATKTRCAALDEGIKRIDDQARQPQSGQSQDWLAARRKELRDEQFRIPCR
jgi:hypothetical protein